MAIASRERKRAGILLLVFALAAFSVVSPISAADLPAFTPEQMGGTLWRNLSGEPQTLNPLTSKDLYASIVQDGIFESLVERDPDTLQFKPMLADRWEISPDGLVITFHLDPRAKFSDGKPVTADDVVFTYETIVNPKIDARDIASYFEDCQGCEKIDDRTVRFTWKKPYFKSFEFSAIQVIPKHVYYRADPNKFNEMNDVLVGTGPYVYKEWKTGQHIILERNKNYWRNPPAIDRIVFRFILEEQASVQALKAGELDDLAVSPEWWVKLKTEPTLADRFHRLHYSMPTSGYSFIGWNNERPPFTDRRVRLAMTHLVWREQMAKYMLYDLWSVAAGPFWPESPQSDSSIKPWPFDRAEAMRLLKEAGWEDRDGDGWIENAEGKRFEFEFVTPSGNQLARDMVRIIGEEFRRAGIKMNVRMIEWSVFTRRLDNRDFDAVTLSWGGGGIDSDPYQIWDSKSIADQGSNFINFRNAEADRLIETARATIDPDRRNALYHQFQRILHEEQPYTFLFARASLRLVSHRIKGVKVHKLGVDPREWWIGRDPAAVEASPKP